MLEGCIFCGTEIRWKRTKTRRRGIFSLENFSLESSNFSLVEQLSSAKQ